MTQIAKQYKLKATQMFMLGMAEDRWINAGSVFNVSKIDLDDRGEVRVLLSFDGAIMYFNESQINSMFVKL